MLQAETEMFNIHILWKVNLSLWKSVGDNTAELFWSAMTRWRGSGRQSSSVIRLSQQPPPRAINRERWRDVQKLVNYVIAL